MINAAELGVTNYNKYLFCSICRLSPNFWKFRGGPGVGDDTAGSADRNA